MRKLTKICINKGWVGLKFNATTAFSSFPKYNESVHHSAISQSICCPLLLPLSSSLVVVVDVVSVRILMTVAREAGSPIKVSKLSRSLVRCCHRHRQILWISVWVRKSLQKAGSKWIRLAVKLVRVLQLSMCADNSVDALRLA